MYMYLLHVPLVTKQKSKNPENCLVNSCKSNFTVYLIHSPVATTTASDPSLHDCASVEKPLNSIHCLEVE